MKTRNILLTAFALLGLVMFTSPVIQAQTCDGDGSNFVDLDGDGFNDNAPDHDGDGIPNGLDPDYVKNAKDGSGYMKGKLGDAKGMGTTNLSATTRSQQFSSLAALSGSMFQKRMGALGESALGGDGTCDGTGGGLNGTGECDGTGPKGGQNQRGK